MSSKRNVRRHACQGKVRYVTYEEAVKACDRNRWLNKDDGQHAFKCVYCLGFHLGHKPHQQLRAMEARRNGD